MEFKIGDKYELEVIDLFSNASGYDYLLTTGPDGKYYKVYNILKYQYTTIPSSIQGIVSGVDIYGKVKFKQDEYQLLQDHYELGHFYTFKIADCTKDTNKKQYYVIEDDFSSQRWYSEEEFMIGDDIVLEAKKVANNGFIKYARYKSISIQTPEAKVTPITKPAPSHTRPIYEGGDESRTVEYKTSIVFPPGNSVADIDKQTFNIVKEIAAFMNADGGTLLIGIHDKTHEITGIENDLPHLGEGESPFAKSYKADNDHYQLKIRDTVVSLCTTIAGSLINITFPKQDDVTYCKVDIQAAKRPIWIKGNMLFQRQGNQVQLLKGESLTMFVGERIGQYIVSLTNNAAQEGLSQENMTSLIHDAVKSAINDRRTKVAAPVSTPSASDIKYWVVWYNDGTWQRQKESSSAPNVFKQIPVTEDTGDIVVAFCYKCGTLNIVKMKDFKKGSKLGKICRDGMNIIEKPMEIYICHPSDLIAIHSADTGGTEYIKLHHITDVKSTESGKNQGPCIIPKNKGHILEFKLVTPVQAVNMKTLIALKKETSHSFGHPWGGINIQKETEYLQSI